MSDDERTLGDRLGQKDEPINLGGGSSVYHPWPESERDPERYSTTDGEPPDPALAGYDAPAPKPIDPETGQHGAYWVLSDSELAKGFVRPVRDSYIHGKCGTLTRMGRKLAETYAREPKFYGATFCATCRDHFPVAEFHWDGTSEVVGS